MRRVSSPPGGSILMTSAPRSDKSMPPRGPAWKRASSSTRMPSSAKLIAGSGFEARTLTPARSSWSSQGALESLLAPAARERLDHQLLDRETSVIGTSNSRAELGREPEVLPREPEREPLRVEVALEHHVRQDAREDVPCPNEPPRTASSSASG